MSKTNVNLEDRIADAFAAQLTSDQLFGLLTEVRAAEAKARDDYARSKDLALDPATRPATVDTARAQMADAEFASSRLGKATEKLEQLVVSAKQREREAAAREERTAALAERDELAEDLQEFGRLTNQMVALLTRLTRNNRRLYGHYESRAESAETVARGTLVVGGVNKSIVEQTRLTSFGGSACWPPASPNNWVEYP